MPKLIVPAAIAMFLLAPAFSFAAQETQNPGGDADHQVFTVHDTRPSAEGNVAQVRCTGDVMQLTLKVKDSPTPLLFHSKDLTHVAYSSDVANLKGDFTPCTDLKGHDVKIIYTAGSSKTIKGELVRVEVTK